MSDGFVFIQADAHLTPAEVELFLNRLNNEIPVAQDELQQARERELEAQAIYTKAWDRLLLSDECPTVGRSKGDVTVAERESWIHTRIEDELWIFKTSRVQRENAESYVWALKDQIKIVQSLGVLARHSLELTGRRHP